MDSKFKLGEKVDLVILRKTDLGFVAKVNDDHEGLIYHSEIFKDIKLKQSTIGYIKKIRPDGGIDLSLEVIGNTGLDSIEDQILKALKKCKGFLPADAKSPAEEIYNLFGLSRKKFKIALGSLYKKRLIRFINDGTELIPENEKLT